MLAEIFLLRLQAMIRRSREEAPPARNDRFVPIAPDAIARLRKKQAREDGKPDASAASQEPAMSSVRGRARGQKVKAI
jgi:hypothetical protein